MCQAVAGSLSGERWGAVGKSFITFVAFVTYNKKWRQANVGDSDTYRVTINNRH